jgi:hypothetical protein
MRRSRLNKVIAVLKNHKKARLAYLLGRDSKYFAERALQLVKDYGKLTPSADHVYVVPNGGFVRIRDDERDTNIHADVHGKRWLMERGIPRDFIYPFAGLQPYLQLEEGVLDQGTHLDPDHVDGEDD